MTDRGKQPDPATLASPSALLEQWQGGDALSPVLAASEDWWRERGAGLSAAIDRMGTPSLHMFDRFGVREDTVAYPPAYRELLLRGYGDGVVARAIDDDSLLPGYRLGHVISFFDPGLYCPYTVSLGTVVPLAKYAPEALRERFLPQLLRRDEGVWQGATWMTEAAGGSDLGANVATVAREESGGWRLSGDKYFASNAGAELAVVAARPAGAADGVRGLALFLVPRRRGDGSLNYCIRRLKDKIGTRSVPTGEIELRDAEAWLLGEAGHGIYLIMEVLNLSRVANSVACVALMQRALAEVVSFTGERRAFGAALLDQPLMRAQVRARWQRLRGALALAWETAGLLDGVWRQTPPYSDAYSLFRLLAHLAKYWTAEEAVHAARWAMECHGGAGVVADYGIERLHREAVILAIWEGPSHRQMLDALELLERGDVLEGLIDHLDRPEGSDRMRRRVAELLAGDGDARQAGIEPVFMELAQWTGQVLAERGPATSRG